MVSAACRGAVATAAMSRARRVQLSLFFLAILGGQLVDVAWQREDWPFSSYPMYSEPCDGRVVRSELVGVGPRGEFPLRPASHFPPLDNMRFQFALRRIARDPDASTRQAAAVAVLAERYEAARAAGRHDDPPLSAIRGYETTWYVESGARNRDAPGTRVLRFEIDVERAFEARR